MKKHLLTLLMLIVFFSANAIVGGYNTYDDFKNGNLISFDGDKYTTNGRFLDKTITGKVKGEEKTFMLKDIYGINIFGELHRIFNYGGAVVTVKLHTTADYQLYFQTYTMENYMDHTQDRTTVIYYISKGLDAPMYRLSTLANLTELGATHPEFKDLIKGCEKYKQDVAGRVSKVIYNSPNFKMGKDVVPPIK